MKIDFHCHAFPAECFQTLKKYYPDVVELKDFETKPLEDFCKCLSGQEIRSLLPVSRKGFVP